MKQPSDACTIFEPRQPRESKADIGECPVTAPPLLGSTFDVPERIG
ncbi:hypothetical protein [Methylovirgula sp. HY1]